MTALDKQFIIDLYDCDATLLNNTAYIEHHLATSAAACGATIIKSVFHAFAPQGITGIIAISESHISIHTWPEYAFATVDVFCCNDKIDIDALQAMLIEAFSAGNAQRQCLQRGLVNVNKTTFYENL